MFREDVVECDLVEASLDDIPSIIVPLGPPEFDHKIIVNGKLITITKSLAALKSYRRSSYTTKKNML
jgi:hypothetical protein